jgi:hypothetical protein
MSSGLTTPLPSRIQKPNLSAMIDVREALVVCAGSFGKAR